MTEAEKKPEKEQKKDEVKKEQQLPAEEKKEQKPKGQEEKKEQKPKSQEEKKEKPQEPEAPKEAPAQEKKEPATKKTKKINRLTLQELEKKIEETKSKMGTLDSDYAHQLLKRKEQIVAQGNQKVE